MMMPETRIATLVVSVDIAREQEESSLLTKVLDVLVRHGMAALWSLEFQRPSALIDRIRGSWAAHEFGLLVDERWAESQIGRTVFGRELAARMLCATDRRIAPLALTFHHSDPPGYYDLLVKHRIALIRTRTDTHNGATGSLQPRLSRYGIWQTEPSIVVPVGSRWSLPWTARRLMQQAIDWGQTLHVTVDCAKLSSNVASGLGSLDYLLKLASARRDSGLLKMVPVSQLLKIYAPRREQFRSRSVLRAA